MPLTIPTATVAAVYSTETHSLIEAVAAITDNFTSEPFAEQITNPTAVSNIDNGALQFNCVLDRSLTPPLARALALDRFMRETVRRTLRDMRPTLSAFSFPVVYWYPNAIGVHWTLGDAPDCPRLAARSSSRLIFAAAKSPSDAIARRFEFDAIVQSWNRILVRKQSLDGSMALRQMKPPRLDCLLRLTPRLSNPALVLEERRTSIGLPLTDHTASEFKIVTANH